MISTQDWNFINSLSVDEACDTFTTKITDCHAGIPSKEVTIRPNNKTWFESMRLRTLYRSRDRQKVKAIKYKNQNDWTKYKVLIIK